MKDTKHIVYLDETKMSPYLKRELVGIIIGCALFVGIVGSAVVLTVCTFMYDK